MCKRLFGVIILGQILIWGQASDIVFSEDHQLYSSDIVKPPKKVVNEFLSQAEDFNAFQGTVPISRIKTIFRDEENVQELNRQFEEDCLNLKGGTTPTDATPCSKAMVALGVLGRANTKDLIIRFLKENKGSNLAARKAGLFALGFWANAKEQDRPEKGLPEGSESFSDPLQPDPATQKSTVTQEIINCLPQSLRSKFHVLNDGFELCDSPWEVKNQNNRDEIRWGLVSLAQTGSKEAREVLESLQGSEGTSRHGFIQELLKLHEKASEENGLLCLNEPENPICR